MSEKQIKIPVALTQAVRASMDKGLAAYGDTLAVSSNLCADQLACGVMALELAHGSTAEALAIYQGACKESETALKAADKAAHKLDKVRSIESILPRWNSAKSPVTSALKKGLDLRDKAKFPTHNDVRKAVATPRKPAGETDQAGETTTRKLSPALESALKAFVSAVVGTIGEHDDTVAGWITAQLGTVERIGKHGEMTDAEIKAARKAAQVRGGSR